MGRWSGSGKTTCESCKAIDVRKWHKSGHLGSGSWFSQHWTCDGEPNGNISVVATRCTAVLNFRCRQYGDDWESVRQEVPIEWTACRFGGSRPWFRCVV